MNSPSNAGSGNPLSADGSGNSLSSGGPASSSSSGGPENSPSNTGSGNPLSADGSGNSLSNGGPANPPSGAGEQPRVTPDGRRIIYYADPRNDDFAGARREPVPIGRDFKFVRRNPFWNALSWFVYRVIMTPVAFLYCKIKYRVKFIKRCARRPARGEGCFLYANHTLSDGDAFLPTLGVFPKRVYTVVSPANLSVPVLRQFVLLNGAIPLPRGASTFRYFLDAVEKRVLQGHCVAVYPEAHVWPYYTGIREFPPNSLRYPVRYGAPVYVSTTTFSKAGRRRTPKVTVYLDGPFTPDKTLPAHAAERKLHSEVLAAMKAAAAHSSYSYIEYREAGKC